MLGTAMFKIEAGDFLAGGAGSLTLGTLALPVKRGLLFDKLERMPGSELAEVEIASEESVKRIGGTVGWGLAGGVLLGPVGLLAGLLAGGNKKRVTFVARLKDGRKFLATGQQADFVKMQAEAFGKSR